MIPPRSHKRQKDSPPIRKEHSDENEDQTLSERAAPPPTKVGSAAASGHRIGRRLVLGLSLLGIVIPGAWLLSWSGPNEISIAVGVTLTTLFLVRFWPQQKPKHPPRQLELPGSLIRAFVRGLLLGLVVLSVSGAVIEGVKFLPDVMDPDRDRQEVEAQVAELLDLGDYLGAIEIIEARLQHRLSADWRAELQQRHVDVLILAGEQASDPAEAAEFFQKAIDVGTEYGVDVQVARLHLEHLQERRAFLSQQREAESRYRSNLADLEDAQRRSAQTIRELQDRNAADSAARRALENRHAQDLNRLELQAMSELDAAKSEAAQQLQAWLSELTRSGNHAGIHAVLSLLVAAAGPSSRGSYARQLLENIVAWGAGSSDLEVRLAKYREGLAAAKQYRLQTSEIENSIRETERALANRPVILPAGTRAVVLNPDDSKRSFGLRVDRPDGSLVKKLKAKDFVLEASGRKRVGVSVTETNGTASSAPTSHLALLLDESPSANPVRPQLLEAVRSLSGVSRHRCSCGLWDSRTSRVGSPPGTSPEH